MTIPSDSISSKRVDISDTPSPEEIIEAAALELVKTDAANCESWIEGQQWNEAWRTIDILYDSPKQFSTFEGSQTQRAAINRFILCQHVNSLHPKFTEGLFYDSQYFLTIPLPGTDSNVMRARAEVIREQLKEMGFEEEVGTGTFQQILHGTGIWKWGLRRVKETFYEYKPKNPPPTQTGPMGETLTVETDEYEEVERTRSLIKPFFENREIRGVLVDPKLKWPDIRRAEFVIDKYYLNLAQLLELAEDPNYDLPDEETLKQWITDPKEDPAMLGNMDPQPGSPTIATQGAPDWFATSVDPYKDSLMVLERWDKYKVITTLNNKKVIQNRPNPYGVIPFYSANFYNRIRSFWGIGDGKIVGNDQRLQQGLENGGIALLQLLLDPPFVTNEDQFVLTQNTRLRKGGNIKVKGDVRTAITPLEMPRLPLGELSAFIGMSKASAEAADGMNEMFTAGSMPGPGTGGKSSATRNATGAAGIIQANASKLMGPVGRFCNQVFLPWIYQLDQLNRRFIMTTPEGVRQFKQILADKFGKDYKFPADEFLNGRVEFDVLAGAHLAAKKAMASTLPIIISILESPNMQQQLVKYAGKYVDPEELLNMLMESTNWRNQHTLFKKVTPQMQQQEQQGEQAGKAQQALALQQLKGQQQEDLQHTKATTGMARDAVKVALTHESDKSLAKEDIINQAESQGSERLLRSEIYNAPETLGE